MIMKRGGGGRLRVASKRHYRHIVRRLIERSAPSGSACQTCSRMPLDRKRMSLWNFN